MSELDMNKLAEQLNELNDQLEKEREDRNALLRERFDLKEQRRYFRDQNRIARAEGNLQRMEETSGRLAELEEKLAEKDAEIEAAESRIDEAGDEVDIILEQMAEAKEQEETTRTAENEAVPDITLENLGKLFQDGMRKFSETLDGIDFGKVSEEVQSAAVKTAKAMSEAAADAARSMEHAWGAVKESRTATAEPGTGDCRLSGNNVVDGGTYSVFTSYGICRVNSDLTCTELRETGSFQVNGNLTCSGQIRANGGLQVEGDLTAEKLTGTGTVHVGGGIHCEEISIPGGLTVKDGIKAQTLQVSGSLKTEGDCEAEQVNASGVVNVQGALSAEKVTIRLDMGQSRIGSVGGGEVKIYPVIPDSFLSGIFASVTGSLVCDSVDGDSLELSSVKAESVRGGRIVIHSGCEIGQVEYTESCEIEDGAKVENCKKAE